MFDWLTSIVDQAGYIGIAFLMLLENVFPPIPSEIIMPLGGFLVHEGRLNGIAVLIAGSAGSLAGTYLWYIGAQRLNRDKVYDLIDRHGWWLTLSRDGMEKAEDWFRDHQDRAVFFGRMVPGVRTLVSVPAGFADMPRWRFAALSLAGTAIWVGFLTGAGYLLGSQYDRVQNWLNPVTNILIGAIVLLYVLRLLRGKGRR